ncbi:MAG: site-specific DNA-methyltransferase [Promethearchaeota archaeon]|nr:MAG: site-specific DNA-methyltransferase [Candidatus Lokiarchaeota archaeon]
MSEKRMISEFEIIIGDVMEKLVEYENYFDLIIADPPFGLEFDKSSHEYGSKNFILYDDKFTYKEYEEFSYQWISKCHAALKENGSMYVISGWTNIDAILNAIRRTDFILKNHNIWFFEWGVYTKRKFVTSHYHIPFLVKDEKNYTFNPYTVNPKSKRKGFPYEKDVWYWPKYNRGNDPDHLKGHPCQLPIMLMKHMIKISTSPGDWVGDVFSGSGGTLLACRELGRNCISIEKNPEYLEIIKKKAKINQEIHFNPDEKSGDEKKVQVKLESFSSK